MNEMFYFEGSWGFGVCGWKSEEIASWLWDVKEKARKAKDPKHELIRLALFSEPKGQEMGVQTGFPEPIYLFIPRWTPKGRLKFLSDIMEWGDFLLHGVNKDLKFKCRF